jgi:hypothetical protein
MPRHEHEQSAIEWQLSRLSQRSFAMTDGL